MGGASGGITTQKRLTPACCAKAHGVGLEQLKPIKTVWNRSKHEAQPGDLEGLPGELDPCYTLCENEAQDIYCRTTPNHPRQRRQRCERSAV